MNSKVSVVFFGSSKYSVIDAKALFDAFGLVLVVTTPDGIDKKTKAPLPNPVKKFAQEHNIPVITTDKITKENIEEIAKYQPDFIVTADIRLILPSGLLTIPHRAAINVHHSLLPKFRGPAPVPFAILSGDKTTGVSIITIAEKVDAGDILAQEKYEMTPEDTTDSVLTILNTIGSQLAVKTIRNFDEYYKNRKIQDESQATYSHYMTKQDGFIDISKPFDSLRSLREKFFGERSRTIVNFPTELNEVIRAYYPWPGVYTIAKINNKETRVKLLPNYRHSGEARSADARIKEGSWSSQDDKFLIQVEGKKPMTYKDFINGYPEGKEILKKLQIIN